MTSKHFAVVGSPIDHSLSPSIHSAAYKFLGLDWDYSRHEVKQGQLNEFLWESGTHLDGISVTMPLKPEAAAIATKSDEIVQLSNIANTLLRVSDEYFAFNTDVFGIEKALAECWGSNINRVAILGSGATAQSALYAVSKMAAAAEISIYVRDITRTDLVKKLADKLGVQVVIKDLNSYSNFQDLTISTIPSNSLDTHARSEQAGWLLNVNYSSQDLSFTNKFNSERVIRGETMLIWQAIAQIRIFLNGSKDLELENESALFAKMASAL